MKHLRSDIDRPTVAVFIYGEGKDDRMLSKTIDHLETWVDDAFVAFKREEQWVWAMGLGPDADSLNLERFGTPSLRRRHLLGLALEGPSTHIAFLNIGQVIANPDLIKPTIKAYANKIVLGTRYWMWGDGTYRYDSGWRPRPVPIVYPAWMLTNAAFEGNYWPDIAITGQALHTELEVQDYTYVDPVTRPRDLDIGVDLRPYSGVQFIEPDPAPHAIIPMDDRKEVPTRSW